MIVIADNLQRPFDEGAKIAAKNIIKCFKRHQKRSTYVISLNSNDILSMVDVSFFANKLLLNCNLICCINNQSSKKILYIPSGSASVFSCIRSFLLKLFSGKYVYLLALQPRQYGLISRFLMRYMHPEIIITQSKQSSCYFNEKLNIKSISLPLGVDTGRYYAFDPARKKSTRSTFGISNEKTVLLHVGHIQQSRNLGWLIDVKKEHPEFEIIVVGSTFNARDDKALYAAFLIEDIKIFREYIPNMAEIYNLADFYVFPVLRQDGAIETPLSVLEAMACNLPVITTRFGSLPDTFKPDKDFFYIDSGEEISNIVTSRTKKTCSNRAKIAPFTWECIAQKIVKVVEE